mmetsp:Transcript_16376/g.30403  ORF Transcript_16376/g.30403 Transcript_16376/m.30403 type:complete len:799 (+) Transcript_16376:131-2527(+)
MASFLEENQDFVLKLKIKAADGQTQIRRVRLPRIADGNGRVSYQELVGLVVVFTFPEAEGKDVSGYHVSLTYYDVDGDSVTIASTEELLDACEQFVGQKVLRITTYVKPKAPAAAAATATATGHASPSRPASATKPAPTASTRGEITTSPPIQIHDVLESFVGVLSTAVNHLQEGLTPPTPNNPRAASVPTRARQEEQQQNKKVEAKESETAAKKPEENNAAEDCKLPAQEEQVKPESSTEDRSSEDDDGEEKEESRPFIHGRHTCDSCLTTPIIGKRYHSTNLKDYDLCANCFSNYKGKEIVFEAVELDRDRAFQERWHRRWKTNRAAMMKAGRFGRFQNRRRQHGLGRFAVNRPSAPPPPPHNGCPPPPPPHHGGPPPHHHHHGHGCPPPPPAHHHPVGLGGFHHHWAHLGPHISPHANGMSSEFDSALKEAIRRSLSDIAPKEAEINKKSDAEVKPSAPVEDAIEKEISDETNKNEDKPAAEAKQEDKSLEIVAKDEEEEEEEGNDIPRSVEIVEYVEEKDDDASKEAAESEDQSKEAKAMEQSMETESVDSEKLVAEADKEEVALQDVPVEREVSKSSKDESFSSDAKGNGDVAELMGALLDQVAGGITDMLSESESSKKNADEGREEEAADLCEASTSGELIVDSTEMPEKKESKDDDSEWSVVKSVGSSATTESEQIAKAAEMLGSALFNSDMKNSSENAHSVSGCGSDVASSFSIPSSVPSDIGTQQSHPAAQAQVDRWAAHLLQLRELGFDNEALCVEVLERLEAANIGVDADDDISINHVVNELLEKQK